MSVAMCGVIWDQPGAGNRRGRRCLARESEDSARGMLKLSHESRPGKIFVTLSWQRAQPRGTRALSCAPRAGCTHGGWHEGDPVLFPVPAPRTEGFASSPPRGSPLVGVPDCGGPRCRSTETVSSSLLAAEEPKAAGRGIIRVYGSACSAFCHVPVSERNWPGSSRELSARHPGGCGAAWGHRALRPAPHHSRDHQTPPVPTQAVFSSLVHTISPARAGKLLLHPFLCFRAPLGWGPALGAARPPMGALLRHGSPQPRSSSRAGYFLARWGISSPVGCFPAERGIS